MSILSILLREDMVISEGVTIDYNFFIRFDMTASFVELSVVVCGSSVYHCL